MNDREASVLEVGVFSAPVPLDLGENEIRVTATDAHGNVGTHRFIIIREDTEGPEIRIIFPMSSAERGFQPAIIVSAESTLVSGTVTDPSGVAEVKVKDIEAQVTGDRFSTRVQLIYGNNLIRVTAKNRLGNQSVKEITIFRPGPLPRTNYALLFAVDTYAHWPGLRYPYVDALNIGRDLEDIYGFQVELIRNPTKTDILRVLREYAQKEYAPGRSAADLLCRARGF